MASFAQGRPRSESGLNISAVGKSKNRKLREFSNDEKKRLSESDLSNGFNEIQLEALSIMREELQSDLALAPDFDELVGDFRLLRFLRGHLYNLGVACDMYRKMLAWRIENDVDEIRNDIVSRNLEPTEFPHYGRIMRYYPCDMNYGVDKEGRPLHIELIGRANPKKMQSSFTQDEWIRYTIYCTEYNSLRLNKLSHETKSLVKVTVIYDLAGAGKAHMSKTTLDTLKTGIKITSDNYPESMQSCFVINAPTIFSVVWKLIKPLLAERTVNKIKILGGGYKKTLHEFVSAENLPVEFGGTKTESFPLVFNPAIVEAIDQDYSELSVSKVEKVSLKVNASSYVLWGYYTESGSIKVNSEFSAENYEEESKDDNDAVHADASCGSFMTESDGEFTLEFDNSAAWHGKKKVNYYMFSVPLDDHKEFESPRNGKLKSFFE